MIRCSSCGAPIFWARSEQNRAMPVDAVPSERGNLRLERLVGGTYVAHVEPAPTGGSRLYTSHFATCPDAASHRRRRAKASKVQP